MKVTNWEALAAKAAPFMQQETPPHLKAIWESVNAGDEVWVFTSGAEVNACPDLSKHDRNTLLVAFEPYDRANIPRWYGILRTRTTEFITSDFGYSNVGYSGGPGH